MKFVFCKKISIVFLVETLKYCSKSKVSEFPFVPRVLQITGVYVSCNGIYHPNEQFFAQNMGSETYKI
jgi:hypothetical protein